MVWYLLLAHFIADFPLQPNWMVQKKIHFGILILHVTIHFLTMMIVLIPASGQLWLYLLVLTIGHFGIDTGKNWFTIHHPQWRAWPYLIDQMCHYLSIGLVSRWIIFGKPPVKPILSQQAAVIGLGFILVTFVYMISERILTSEKTGYLPENLSQIWMRLYARATLLGLLLAGWKVGSLAAGAQAMLMPYPTGQVGQRIILTDIFVTLLTALLVILIARNL